jgi:hypothetical protein
MIYRPYTPSRQDPEVLERTATGREDCLSGLLASIEEASEKPIRQHWLLIGPRGIGKSYIIALLFHRIKRAPGLMAKWLPISFPEEAAGIITLRDFMEKVTRLCHEELENEGLSDEALRFRKILESVDGEASSRRAVNQIRESLIDWRNKSRNFSISPGKLEVTTSLRARRTASLRPPMPYVGMYFKALRANGWMPAFSGPPCPT